MANVSPLRAPCRTRLMANVSPSTRGTLFRALRTAAQKEAEEVAKEKAKKKAEEDMHKDIEARLWWDAVFERWWQRVENGTAKVGMGPYAGERARMQGIDVPKLRLPPLINNARVKRGKN